MTRPGIGHNNPPPDEPFVIRHVLVLGHDAEGNRELVWERDWDYQRRRKRPPRPGRDHAAERALNRLARAGRGR